MPLNHFRSSVMQTTLLAIVACLPLEVCSGQSSQSHPVYQRQRQHSTQRYRGHRSRGNFARGGYGAYSPLFFYPPTFFGSWYQRPYPTHLDYFRLRDGRSQIPRRQDEYIQEAVPEQSRQE